MDSVFAEGLLMENTNLTDLSKLSSEKQAVLNDEQKAIFCLLSAADQEFFASSISVKDLPTILSRKGEIMKRNAGQEQHMKELVASFADEAAPPPPGEADGSLGFGEIATAVAGAVGIGAAVAVANADGTARWKGVAPSDLIASLRQEFEDSGRTSIRFDGSTDNRTATVLLVTSDHSESIPALTIQMTAIQEGIEVKVGDLTSHGVTETIKEGGKTLLGLAKNGLNLVSSTRRGILGGGDMLNALDGILSEGSNAAEISGNLKLKDRAWKTIKTTADLLEKAWREKKELERQVQFAQEKSWDNYTNCPNCSVPFGAEDTQCRVCGTARPPQPTFPDPRVPPVK
jgi:hypothetical protein